MDLKDFVKQTVCSIVRGTEEIESELKREVHLHDKENENIEFDIALTVKEENAKGGSGSIAIASLGIGGSREKKNESSTINRIQFSLYVNSKTKEEVDKTEREHIDGNRNRR